MMPFSGAPKNKKKSLPSTEQSAPQPADEGKDLESMVAGCSREELVELQEMVSARLESMDQEASAEDSIMEDEDEQA